MAVIDNDFERFLYANFPDDFRRISVDGVGDDIVTSIKSKHASTYNKWQRIPEWIKNEYQDRLPKDLLNGNERVKDFVYDEIRDFNQVGEDRYDAKPNNFSYASGLLALGYGLSTIEELEKNRKERREQEYPVNSEAWARSRARDRDTIERDLKENQPEKYLMHLLKDVSRAEKRGDNAILEIVKVRSNMKVTSGLREIDEYLKKFDNKELLDNLEKFLLEPRQQKAFSHLDEDLKDSFLEILGQNGVDVEKIKTADNAIMSNASMAEKIELRKDLKKDYNIYELNKVHNVKPKLKSKLKINKIDNSQIDIKTQPSQTLSVQQLYEMKKNAYQRTDDIRRA